MAGVSNSVSLGADRFADYERFAQEQVKKGSGKAIVRLTDGRKVTKSTDGDFVGRIGRGDQRKRCNNDARDDFLECVLAQCGKKTVNDLPPGVKKALELGDFGLGSSGKANSGKPLTARRIMAVRQAIQDYKLKGPKDPLSDLPMRQTGGSALCYVNSFINAMKRTDAGRKYLKSIFTPEGCTLFTKESALSKVFNPTTYTYSKIQLARIQLGNEVCDCRRFSKLEQVMSLHKVKQEGIYCGRGGTGYLGATMLGLTATMFSSLRMNAPGTDRILNKHESAEVLYLLVEEKLKSGNLVIHDPGGHVRAITNVRKEKAGVDDQQNTLWDYYFEYTDDAPETHIPPCSDPVYWEKLDSKEKNLSLYQFAPIPQEV